MRDLLLGGHIAVGVGALLLAVALLAGRGHWSGAAGRLYGVLVLATCASALMLTGWQSALPGAARVVLAVVALATVAATAAGLAGARRGTTGHLRLLHGSVVSLATAVAVVSAPVVVWVAVAVAGTAVVEVTSSRRRAGTKDTGRDTALAARTSRVP